MKKGTSIALDEEQLIRLSEVSKLLGLKADTNNTCRLAASQGLTIVFTSSPMASRVTIRLLTSEVVEWANQLGVSVKSMRTKIGLPADLSKEERLITLSVGATILGVSPDAIRKRQAPTGVEQLTVIDISRPGAQRRTLRLVYSEVVALRDRLIQTARDRMNVDRMLERRFARTTGKTE